uniref:Tail protein n=1 Tax=viral metagenome TaxID=1070528 RepID=A0A6M3JTJ5_9ZZZZ
MVQGTENVELTPGYMTLTDAHGRKTQHPIAPVLRAADIPDGLTYTQVPDITKLANLVVVLIRTLSAQGIIADSFMEEGEYDLALITDVIDTMGGSFTDPVLSPA